MLGTNAGVQLVDVSLRAAPDPSAVVLTAADVPEMLDLVDRCRPGPFRPRTVEMGTYLGLRHHGRLIVMAGERLHPPGLTQISAVCTDPAHRSRGLATRLVRAVAAGIRARGETPFLHAAVCRHDRDPAVRVDRLPAPPPNDLRALPQHRRAGLTTSAEPPGPTHIAGAPGSTGDAGRWGRSPGRSQRGRLLRPVITGLSMGRRLGSATPIVPFSLGWKLTGDRQ